MNHKASDNETKLIGDERWIDAVLGEHARLGADDDELLLARIEKALRSPARRKNKTLWWLAAAACFLLVATTIFRNLRDRGRDSEMLATANHENRGIDTEGSLKPGQIKLTTEFPPSVVEGSPRPMPMPQLVPVPKGPPTLVVPKETVLLSKGKPVTSSDDFPIIGDLSMVTDGVKDSGEGYFIELLNGLQWVQIDLQQSATIHAVWIWHFHSQRRAYHDVIVQVSDDPEFRKGVTTVYNNDYDNSAKMGVGKDNPYIESNYGLLVNAKGVSGRYVRLYSNGNTTNELNHYVEVEVFGVAKP